MKAQIIEKSNIAQGTLLVKFKTLEPRPIFKCGQYFFVTLPSLNYPDQRGNRRHFSIVNSPNEKDTLTLATRMRESSGFKKTLAELEIGTEVEVGPISGSFVLPEDTKRPLVFISGGIGITPFISQLRYVKEEKLPFNITLIYSNRSKESTPFLSELQGYPNNINQLKLVLTMTEDASWTGEKRKIDSQFIKEYASSLQNPLYFVVGPPPMVEAIDMALKQDAINSEDIRIENFSGY